MKSAWASTAVTLGESCASNSKWLCFCKNCMRWHSSNSRITSEIVSFQNKSHRSRSRSRTPDRRHRRKRRRDEGDTNEEKEVPIDFTADITPEEMQMMQAMGIPFVSSFCCSRLLVELLWILLYLSCSAFCTVVANLACDPLVLTW